MRDIKIEGRSQLNAGKALLEASRLVLWDSCNQQFSTVGQQEFENSWKEDLDPVYGRVACWIHFSVGAEFFLKGVLLLNDLDMRKSGAAPCYPTNDIDHWASCYRHGRINQEKVGAVKFGSLGGIVSNDKETSLLENLCSKNKATDQQENLVIAGYGLLQRAIRNRDAHAYVPNVRDSHNYLVRDLYAPLFNILMSWIPDGPSVLTEWNKDSAGAGVDS